MTRLRATLGLDRNTGAVAAAMFLQGMGEQMWRRFIPKYLESLGAPITTIGLFGTAEDFLDGAYQYPGGWLADRYGRRRALEVVLVLAAAGYAIYLVAPRWPVLFAGLLFVSAWNSMGQPTLFAVVGDALPPDRRTLGFTVQAVLRRVPIALAPTIGGIAIATLGVRGGMRAGLVATLVVTVVTLTVVARVRLPVLADREPTGIRDVWAAFPTPLRWLLTSDVLIRTCDGLVDIFLVLYATEIIGVSAARFGALIGVQAVTSMLSYLPAARLANRTGRKPFVIATFLAFSLFPIAVVSSHSATALTLAFVVGGLRELGEPARKALIVSIVQPTLRARSVGLYYLIRSVAIAPAAFVGGLLWRVRPSLPFLVAGAIGLAGTTVFTVTVRSHDAA
ncbi:MAG TPA: MFS transporter [Gemmatimonadaceae bacterium]|jgi:MFS family permease|nr:MFS transporter [Gemmatimonadaceae bacterium]